MWHKVHVFRVVDGLMTILSSIPNRTVFEYSHLTSFLRCRQLETTANGSTAIALIRLMKSSNGVWKVNTVNLYRGSLFLIQLINLRTDIYFDERK